MWACCVRVVGAAPWGVGRRQEATAGQPSLEAACSARLDSCPTSGRAEARGKAGTTHSKTCAVNLFLFPLGLAGVTVAVVVVVVVVVGDVVVL